MQHYLTIALQATVCGTSSPYPGMRARSIPLYITFTTISISAPRVQDIINSRRIKNSITFRLAYMLTLPSSVLRISQLASVDDT